MNKILRWVIIIILVIGIPVIYSILTKNRIYLILKYSHQSKKEINSIGNYDTNGYKIGEWNDYDKKNRLVSKRHYINDTMHGLSETFYENGKIHTMTNYYMGIMIDTFKLYYPNGQINLIQFADSTGLEQGEFKVYHDNGNMRQIGKFKNGRLDGEITTWFKSGAIETITNYDAGQNQGKKILFDKNGDTLKILNYKNNLLIDSILFN